VPGANDPGKRFQLSGLFVTEKRLEQEKEKRDMKEQGQHFTIVFAREEKGEPLSEKAYRGGVRKSRHLNLGSADREQKYPPKG